jgi:hypothetical protein
VRLVSLSDRANIDRESVHQPGRGGRPRLLRAQQRGGNIPCDDSDQTTTTGPCA